MTFIGMSANQKDFEILKSKFDGLNIIRIDDDNIQNLQNIKFDSIIIHEKMSIKKHVKAFEKICKNLRYFLVNFDKNVNVDILKNNRMTVITYGLNHKSTITASSIQEDYIMVALQRDIFDREGKLQEIREQPIKTVQHLDIYGHMLMFVLSLLYNS